MKGRISGNPRVTKQYAATALAIGTPCHGHVKWPISPPSVWCTTLAVSAAAITMAVFDRMRSVGERCSSPRVMQPAAATIVIAHGP
jgi:hypothetical protein